VHIFGFLLFLFEGVMSGSTSQVEMSNIFCKYISQITFLGVTGWLLCRLL
jgi:hypothetical protein